MKKYILAIIFLGYTSVSLIFYPHLWRQLIHDESRENAVYGEVVAASWGMEQLYENIREGNNPFAYRLGQLYPFGNSLLSTDSGNGFFFLALRPWLSIHQSFSLVVIFSVVMAAMGMYLMLVKLGVQTAMAFILGAGFGFTTILQPRMGHLTYMSIYVFPWFIYSVSKNRPIWAALFLALSLYHNLYYFVILVLIALWLLAHHIWTNRGRLQEQVQSCYRQIITFMIASLVFLSPWLTTLVKVARFEGLPRTSGWGGAIDFSADLFGVFIPSTYSKYLWTFNDYLGKKLPFVTAIFEEHIYPGIILLAGLVLIGSKWKKIGASLKKQLTPWLIGTIGFWILTLGPFLHILGRWNVNLEGIPFVIPLPYAILHYLPFMENIRSPGRLAIGMVFFGYTAVGIFFSKSKLVTTKTKYWLLITALAVIVLIDHQFVYAPAKPRTLPTEIYETIKNDPDQFAVYEMPSAVRDGFKYFGNLESLDFISGQLIHGKPMIAGYFGRVPDFKREYLAHNPLFGYLGRIMDQGIEHNGAIDRTELDKWRVIDPELSRQAAELVDLKYVVLQDDAFYSASASAALTELSYEKVQTEKNFSLWQTELLDLEIREVKVGKIGDDMNLGGGWRGRDKDFRWAGKTSSILLRLKERDKYRLVVEGATYHRDQVARVYINQKYVGKLAFDTKDKLRTLELDDSLPSGLVTIHLIFPDAYQPIKVEPGNLDESHLSARISYVGLEVIE